MKRKGFTLIELLAVIVVLAIIALIATPIVLNVIERTKKGAAERTAELYIDAVETTLVRESVKHNELGDGVYNILSDGSICLEETDCEETAVKIEGTGDKPSSGLLVIKDGTVVPTNDTNVTSLEIKDYTVSYNSEKGAYVATKIGSEDEIVTPEPEPKLICEKTGEASKTVGAEYSCVLEDGEPRTFYVLENIESSENISLIMDRNFTDNVVRKTLTWCIDGGTNNRTCQNINSKEEDPLKHIQDTFGNNVEVSFPTYDQIKTANNGNTSNLPQWLYDYLNGTTHPVSGVYGYWTASPIAGLTNYAWRVGSTGIVDYYHVDNSTLRGVRPVITISKSLID